MGSGIDATSRPGGRLLAARPLALLFSALTLAFAVALLLSSRGHPAGAQAQTTTTLFPQRSGVPGVTQTTLSTTTRPAVPGFTPTTPGFSATTAPGSATTGGTTTPTLGSVVTTPPLVTTTTRFGTSTFGTTTGAPTTPARTGTASVAWFAAGLAALVLGFQVSLFSRPRGAHAVGRRGRRGEFYVRSWRSVGWAPPRQR